jgi:hypothetical protein
MSSLLCWKRRWKMENFKKKISQKPKALYTYKSIYYISSKNDICEAKFLRTWTKMNKRTI